MNPKHTLSGKIHGDSGETPIRRANRPYTPNRTDTSLPSNHSLRYYWAMLKNKFFHPSTNDLQVLKEAESFSSKSFDGAQQIDIAKKLLSPPEAAAFIKNTKSPSEQALRIAFGKLDLEQASLLSHDLDLPSEIRFLVSIRLKELRRANP